MEVTPAQPRGSFSLVWANPSPSQWPVWEEGTTHDTQQRVSPFWGRACLRTWLCLQGHLELRQLPRLHPRMKPTQAGGQQRWRGPKEKQSLGAAQPKLLVKGINLSLEVKSEDWFSHSWLKMSPHKSKTKQERVQNDKICSGSQGVSGPGRHGRWSLAYHCVFLVKSYLPKYHRGLWIQQLTQQLANRHKDIKGEGITKNCKFSNGITTDH